MTPAEELREERLCIMIESGLLEAEAIDILDQQQCELFSLGGLNEKKI